MGAEKSIKIDMSTHNRPSRQLPRTSVIIQANVTGGHLDILSTISFVHRRLDEAQKTCFAVIS